MNITNKTLNFLLLFIYSNSVICSSDNDDNVDEISDDYNMDETLSQLGNYSALGLPLAAYPQGGILIQFTDTGLSYIVNVIERAAVKLLKNFPIPDTERDGFTIKNVTITRFDDPSLKSRFVNQTGMEINMTIPQLDFSAKYSGEVGWFESKGTAKASIKDLVVRMLLRIEKGDHGFPSLKLPVCYGKVGKFRMVFSDEGWGGTLLNSMRGVVESLVTQSLGGIICGSAKNAADLFDTIFLDWDGPMVMDPKVICGDSDLNTNRKSAASPVLTELDGLGFDTTLDGNAYFNNDQVVAGLKGEFLQRGRKTGLSPGAQILSSTNRMICFGIKEIVPNSFGLLLYRNNLLKYDRVIGIADFPANIRVPLRLLCGSCKLNLHASSVETPKVEFTRSGIKALIKMNLKIDGRGFFNSKLKVVEAIANLEVTTNLFVAESRVVKGRVTLGNIVIKIQDRGLGGVFDKPLNALLRKQIVPEKIWPVVRDRINKAIEENGFKLPAMCGLSFVNTDITYTSGMVVVGTDVRYDLEGFVDRFTKWQRQQAALNVSNAG